MRLYEESRDGWWKISKKYGLQFSIIIGFAIATIINVNIFFLSLTFPSLLSNTYGVILIFLLFIIIGILSIGGVYFWLSSRIERTDEIEFLGDNKKFEETIVAFERLINKMFYKKNMEVAYNSHYIKMYNLPFINCKINIQFYNVPPSRISIHILDLTKQYRNDVETLKINIMKMMDELNCKVDERSPDLTHFTDKQSN